MNTSQSRYNKYQIMWILAAFDLPTETKKDRHEATKFRKVLLDAGFSLFQFSIYVRHCPSRENMWVHIERLKKHMPPSGKVSFMHFTDAQFGKIITFYGAKPKKQPDAPRQLSFF